MTAPQASASPFCYQTGPGYEKCIDSPSGDYFHPFYQGPQLPDGYLPSWSPPVYAAPVSPIDLLAAQVQSGMQGFFDNPANGKTQYNVHFGRVALVRTGDSTYEGTVAASTGGGPELDIPVHVTTGDGNAAWNLDPGALLPLFQ